MGRHDRDPVSAWRPFGPTFSSKSVFEEILDGWIDVLDEQLDQPRSLGPSLVEREQMEAARGTYARLRDRARH